MGESDPKPDLEWETRAGYPRARLVGVDEVGRGCIAGPVVAGAVLLPSVIDFDANPWLGEIRDSKLLKPEARERLATLIHAWAGACGIASATVAEIEEENIHYASHLAMLRAVKNLGVAPEHILVDGKFVPKGFPCASTAIVKGDQKALSIAAASIIAKVWRDRHLVELDREFPGYGFASHKGYGTAEHYHALRERGVCALHRRSFAPIAEILGNPPIDLR